MGESGGVRSLESFKERFGAQPVSFFEYSAEWAPLRKAAYARARIVEGVESVLVKRPGG